jgi:hypothetical protein
LKLHLIGSYPPEYQPRTVGLDTVPCRSQILKKESKPSRITSSLTLEFLPFCFLSLILEYGVRYFAPTGYRATTVAVATYLSDSESLSGSSGSGNVSSVMVLSSSMMVSMFCSDVVLFRKNNAARRNATREGLGRVTKTLSWLLLLLLRCVVLRIEINK